MSRFVQLAWAPALEAIGWCTNDMRKTYRRERRHGPTGRAPSELHGERDIRDAWEHHLVARHVPEREIDRQLLAEEAQAIRDHAVHVLVRDEVVLGDERDATTEPRLGTEHRDRTVGERAAGVRESGSERDTRVGRADCPDRIQD